MRFFLNAIRACALYFILAFGLLAQQAAAPDYGSWETVATRAEEAVENARASDSAFANLRSEVAEWREEFQAHLNTNDTRIGTIQDQIKALGPVPEDGTEEAPEIAERRAELNAQMARLTTPRRTAEEAFSRANGIIAEIDAITRSRQADALLNAGPIPINPVHWPDAISDLSDTLRLIVSGTRGAFQNPSRIQELQNNLPLVLLLIVVAIVLLTRSRAWSERLALRIASRGTGVSDHLAGFAISLGQILFPVLGAVAFLLAMGSTELYGPRGEVVLYTAIPVAVLVFGARWIGARLFPDSEQVRTPIGTPLGKRRRGRTYATVLGIILALRLFLSALSDYENYAPETWAVLAFPLLVVAGLVLMGLGQMLRHHDPELVEGANPAAYRHQFIRFLGRTAVIIGFIGPLLAAAGYTTAAQALVFPAALSLAVIGIVAILQDVIRLCFAWFAPGEGAGDGLLPTLAGFFLVLLSVPLMALIWGTRVTDLTELWSRARSGIVIGETTISPGAFLTLAVVFVVGYFLTRALQGSLRTSVLPKTRIDPGGQTAIVSGVGYVGIFLSALIAISAAGLDLSGLAIVAGALSVGIGFGLQNIVSNFVSGIILLIERPISEGDWIEVGGQQGYVRKVSVRSTRIETFDRTDVIVPNSDLVSGSVTNYTRGNTVGRAIVSVGVAYGSDTRLIDKILREIAEEHPMVLANPAPTIYFAGFGASSLDFEIRAILRDVNFMLSVKNEIHHRIAERFTEEGIEIPFPQQDLWLRNADSLANSSASEGK